MFHLIGNAIKFRHPKRNPIIDIKTTDLENGLLLTIADNGLGFDAEFHKENLFGLYKRFHTHVEGRGVGLFLVKMQILAMNGHITIESKVGIGTVFSIHFKTT